MADEVSVTIVFLLPNDSGGYSTKEFPDIVVNTRAPVKRLIQAILNEFQEFDFSVDDVDMMVQISDGSTLSSVNIKEGSRIVLMPKFTGPLVKRRN
jgi:hypothetical protein